MSGRYLGLIAMGLLAAAFFASRPLATLAQPREDHRTLVAVLDDAPLTRAQIRAFVRAGTPALDAVINDLTQSKFARQVRQNVGRGYNLGRAMDRDVYASNVIKVAEAFGMVGVDRLVRRVDPRVVKAFGLDTPAFRKAGIGTIKPLLAGEVIRGTAKLSPDRLRAWIDEYVVVDKIEEIKPGGIAEFWKEVAEAAATLIMPRMVMLKGSLDKPDLVRPVTTEKWWEMLSPAARTRVMLRELDPCYRGTFAASTL